MKLAWKIFCAAYCIVMVTVGAGGFALVQAASDSMADSRRDAVLTSNEYAGKMFYALAENGPSIQPRTKQIQDQIAKMVGTDQTERLTIGNAQETASYHSDSFVDRLASSQQGWTFVDMDGKPTLQAVTRVDFSGEPYYIETLSDFSGVYAQREQLMRVYRTTVVAAALLSGAALLGLSLAVTYPLRRLSQAANQVAAGGTMNAGFRSGGAVRKFENFMRISTPWPPRWKTTSANSSRKLKSGKSLWPISPTN